MTLKDIYFFRFFINSEFIRNRYKINDFNFKNNQKGGYNIIYKNNKIIFDEEYENDIMILSFKSINKKSDCIVLLYDKKEKIINIERLDLTNKCINNYNSGKDLMNIIIKVIYKYKKTLGLKEIYLSDHSYILCDGIYIWLSNLSLLQYGKTFYGRYGFVPVNEDDKMKLNKNIIRLNKTRIKYIKNILIKLNLSNYLTNYLKTNNNENFMDFMKYISRRLFDEKKCKILNKLIDECFFKLKLFQMNNKQYYIKL